MINKYYPDIEVNTKDNCKYNIKDINNLKEVKKQIKDYYRNKYISNKYISKVITNIETGLNIEIWNSGIDETLGNANYYKNLRTDKKEMKLATMDYLAKMIKYGSTRADSALNYHNKNSNVIYHYLEHPIKVDNIEYMVNIDIRKVPNINGRFYIHSIDIKNGVPKK